MRSGLISDRKSSQYSDKKVRSGKDIFSGRHKSSKKIRLSNNWSSENIGLPNDNQTALSSHRKKNKKSSDVDTSITGISKRSDIKREGVSDILSKKSSPIRMSKVDDQYPVPADMVSAGGSNYIFVQADQFSPRFPAGTSSAVVAGGKFNRTQNQSLGFGLPVAIVYFKNNSSKLNNQAKDRIRRVLKLYRNGGKGSIKVIGHASSRTPNMVPPRHHLANLEVSNKRANAVAGELMRLGVKPDMIMVSAIADQEPAFVEVMPAGEAGNRRAEIFFAR